MNWGKWKMTNNKLIVNKNYLEHLEQQAAIGKHLQILINNSVYGIKKPVKPISMNELREKMGYGEIDGDARYNEPKQAPKADAELVDNTISATEIYRKTKIIVMSDNDLTTSTKEGILKVQRKQVAYGIDKYPEALSPNTWSAVETIDHILDESMDKLHYLVMLTIKMEQELVSRPAEDYDSIIDACDGWNDIGRMIDNAVEEMAYLVGMREKLTVKKSPNMSMSGADMDGDKCVRPDDY